MIRTIIFDFGGVLYHPPDLKWIKRWAKLLGSSHNPETEKVLSESWDSALMRDVFLGKVSEGEIWESLQTEWQISPRLVKLFRNHAFSRRRLNKPMVKFLAALQADYQTAILSNAGDQTRKLIENHYHLGQFADEIIISAEEGLVKPDPALFEITMSRLGAVPAASLLLDDTFENIEAARDFGIHAVHFQDNSQAVQSIREFLAGKDE